MERCEHILIHTYINWIACAPDRKSFCVVPSSARNEPMSSIAASTKLLARNSSTTGYRRSNAAHSDLVFDAQAAVANFWVHATRVAIPDVSWLRDRQLDRQQFRKLSGPPPMRIQTEPLICIYEAVADPATSRLRL